MVVMELLDAIRQELLSIFSLGPLIGLVTAGDYESLKSSDGWRAILLPLIPVSIVVELCVVLLHRKFTLAAYKVPLTIYVVNRIALRFISLSVMFYCIKTFSPYKIFSAPNTWYWFIYGYLVFEFAHVLSHYLSHKVRLLWCLHSTHHAPRHLNLSVSFSHFILEFPYAEFIKVTICTLAGVPLPMLVMILVIDGVWGHLIHVGEDFIKDGRMGFMEKFILTPAHHRAHHAKNPLYMDTNFGNLVPVWDRLLGTYQPLRKEVKPEYGITRKIDTNSFLDVYFGEIYYLWKDIVAAPGLLNKLKYLFMAPGWRHDGEPRTASVIRRQFLESC